jgi:hypothetical protein
MKKLNAFLLILVLLLGAASFVQRQIIQRLQKDNKGLLDQSARSSADEGQKAGNISSEPDRQQIERDRNELLRLRAEVSALRRAVTNAVRSAKASAPAVSPPPPEPPVKIFETTSEVLLQPGETFVTGGWETSPGKRTLVFASPTVIDAAGNVDPAGNQITLRTRFVEMPEAVLQSLNPHQSPRSDGIIEATFNENRTEELFERLRNTSGVDMLEPPPVTTLPGRQTQIAAQDALTFDGEKHWVGPMVDFVPAIAQNGAVSLNLAPKIVLPNPNWGH